jgi:hypothetical protein
MRAAGTLSRPTILATAAAAMRQQVRAMIAIVFVKSNSARVDRLGLQLSKPDVDHAY